ncbi:MAG TPA: hypothetical protein VMP01_27620 [Pirellulaceae bacterium]|nr:hypothetical protein [Pirellulaceae bacterium]
MPDLHTATPPDDAPPLNLVRLVLIGAALPAAIAAVNYAWLRGAGSVGGISPVVCLQFAWYVVQVGIVGYVVGRWISRPVPRWLLFGWILLFIDLLAATFAINARSAESALLSAGLWSGQMGLCVVWAFFGDTRWTLRWPAMIVASGALYFLWLTFGSSWGQRLWNELLVWNVVTLSVMCGLLGVARFRLRYVAPETAASADSARRPLQFGIKHVLMWTTALAILLGAAKGLDLLRWQVAVELVRAGLPWKLSVATISAMVIVVALWVALGRGHWLLRFAAGVCFTLAVGTGLAQWSIGNATVARRAPFAAWGSQMHWELLAWYEIGWGWLGWMFLSGGLLAATLIILRVRGYRLVRVAGH